MRVKLKLCDAYKPAMPGRPEFVEVIGTTVGGCIKDFMTKYPQMESYLCEHPGEICPIIQIFHNGLSISLNELDTPVKDGDEIFPLLMIGGG